MIGKTIIIGALVSFAGAVLVSRVASNGAAENETGSQLASSLPLRTAAIAIAAR